MLYNGPVIVVWVNEFCDDCWLFEVTGDWQIRFLKYSEKRLSLIIH
jgi:hypothetical protein